MDTNWKLVAPVPCGGTVDVSNDERVSSADGVVSACVRWSSELNFAPETATIVHTNVLKNFYFQLSHVGNIYTVSQKQDTKLLPTTLPNIGRFT